jgi:uncharacterized membrane protein
MVDILMVLITWLHIVGFVIWLGGAIFFSFILTKNVEVIPVPERGKLMGAVEKQFTPIAWASLTILAITGLLRMYLSGSLNVAFLTGTSYGTALLLKIILFGVILIGGYIITTTSIKMGSASSPEEAMGFQKRIIKQSKTNEIIGVIVIFLAIVIKFGGF